MYSNKCLSKKSFVLPNIYCERHLFRRFSISLFRSKLKLRNNSRVLIFATRWDLNIDSHVLGYEYRFPFYRNCSLDLFFANRRRFTKFVKINKVLAKIHSFTVCYPINVFICREIVSCFC
uniref:Putative homeobox transcription factor sip1 n=1 Tax=Ixodes ricinus TaxID=34613 RepID=A0A0K8R4V4_IXORI